MAAWLAITLMTLNFCILLSQPQVTQVANDYEFSHSLTFTSHGFGRLIFINDISLFIALAVMKPLLMLRLHWTTFSLRPYHVLKFKNVARTDF